MDWRELTRRQIAGILLVILVAGILCFGGLAFPNLQLRANFGFGPEWDCLPQAKGDPVCMKRTAKTGDSN
jgi:hypothetical protein